MYIKYNKYIIILNIKSYNIKNILNIYKMYIKYNKYIIILNIKYILDIINIY